MFLFHGLLTGNVFLLFLTKSRGMVLLLLRSLKFRNSFEFLLNVCKLLLHLARVIEQPNFRIPNPQYSQRNFCLDFFNDSENTF